jgi:hypothetical protein
MNKSVVLLSVFCLAGAFANGQNLLSNGDFELPADGSPATDWTPWSWNSGWANTEMAGWGSGSWHIAVGAPGDGGGGYYQIVSATPGISYSLSVDSGADAWWLPTGRMEMFFLDASTNVITSATRLTVDPAVYGEDQYDVPHPWENYALAATAPDGTAMIKVEFSSNESTATPGNASGSVGFDNAVLLVPEPTTTGLLALGSILLLGWRRRQGG